MAASPASPASLRSCVRASLRYLRLPASAASLLHEMSKFRVRAVFGSVVKPIELNRNNYSFNEVRDEVRVKHELRDFQLRYVSPSLGDLFIQDNDSFRRVVKDAELRGVPYVEIKVVSHERAAPSGGKGSATPTHSYNQSHNQSHSHTPSHPSPAPHSAPSPSPSYGGGSAAPQARYNPSPAPAAARASSPSNVIATFVVQGDRNSTADRLSLKADQANDHFAFVPVPAKCNSDVSILLEGSKLTCESVTNHPDGRSIKFTQAFNLPFVPAPNNIHHQGQTLKIFF